MNISFLTNKNKNLPSSLNLNTIDSNSKLNIKVSNKGSINLQVNPKQTLHLSAYPRYYISKYKENKEKEENLIKNMIYSSQDLNKVINSQQLKVFSEYNSEKRVSDLKKEKIKRQFESEMKKKGVYNLISKPIPILKSNRTVNNPNESTIQSTSNKNKLKIGEKEKNIKLAISNNIKQIDNINQIELYSDNSKLNISINSDSSDENLPDMEKYIKNIYNWDKNMIDYDENERLIPIHTKNMSTLLNKSHKKPSPKKNFNTSCSSFMSSLKPNPIQKHNINQRSLYSSTDYLSLKDNKDIKDNRQTYIFPYENLNKSNTFLNDKLKLQFELKEEKDNASIFYNIIGICRKAFNSNITEMSKPNMKIDENVFNTFGFKSITSSMIDEITMLGYNKIIINNRYRLENDYRKETMNLIRKKLDLSRKISTIKSGNSKLFKKIERKRVEIMINKSKIMSSIEELKRSEKMISIYVSCNKITQSDAKYSIKKIRNEIKEKENELVILNNQEIENKQSRELKEYEENVVLVKNYEIDEEENNSKLDFLIEEQIFYYKSLLSKGLDSRIEGIVWILKILIEYKASIDHNIFPLFLTHSNIRYLCKLAHKETELNQYRLILRGLKIRQHQVNKEQKELIYSTINTENVNFISKFKTNPNETSQSVNKKQKQGRRLSYESKIENENKESIEMSKEMYNKHLKLINNSKEIEKFKKIEKENNSKKKRFFNLSTQNFYDQNKFYQQESTLINVAYNKLKRKMITFANEEGVFEVDVTNDIRLAQYFEVNMKQQEYFKEIYRIKEVVEEIEAEVKNMKKSKYENLISKFKAMSNANNLIKLIELDLVYSALFGSSFK